MPAEQVIDFNRLLVADQGNDTEAGGLARVIFLVFRLLQCRREQGGDADSFLSIDFAVATGPGDSVGDGVRTEANPAGITQRLDALIVGNHVAELDDFRHAPEMLNEAGSAPEGLAREVINGDLAVVEVGIGNPGEVLEDEILNDAEVLPYGGRADLLVVADHEHRLAEIQGAQ